MSTQNGQETVTRLAVSVIKAAALIGVTDRHLWDEIKSGKLRTVRSGMRVLVPMEAIHDYLKPRPEPVAERVEEATSTSKQRKKKLRTRR